MTKLKSFLAGLFLALPHMGIALLLYGDLMLWQVHSYFPIYWLVYSEVSFFAIVLTLFLDIRVHQIGYSAWVNYVSRERRVRK